MSRRAKRTSRSTGKGKRAKVPRKNGFSRLFARLLKIPLVVITLSGLLAAAALVALFIFSALFTWLFDTVEIVPEPPRDISLEILNGCGAGGAAKELTSILRNQGFAVADFRNAESFDYAHTVVKVRNVDREKGEAFAAYLGCRNIVHEERDRATTDICVVVGEDWRNLAIIRGRDEARDSLTRMIDFFKKVTYFK
jgi:hypothetical protein